MSIEIHLHHDANQRIENILSPFNKLPFCDVCGKEITTLDFRQLLTGDDTCLIFCSCECHTTWGKENAY